MRLHPTLFKLHRWLAYLVGLQILLWVAGGVVFSVLPFEAWVKGGAVASKPVAALPATALQIIGPALAEAELAQAQVFVGPQGSGLKARSGENWRHFDAQGRELAPPDAPAIAEFAQRIYRGEGRLLGVLRADDAQRRLGIVAETSHFHNLWQARFDDRLATRLYFDSGSGEFLFVRNEAWVLYDFFWRLHLMDYQGGEDFNNTLLRVFALSALAFALTGIGLSLFALRRAWLRRKK